MKSPEFYPGILLNLPSTFLRMKHIIVLLLLFHLGCQFPIEHSELPETQKFLVIDAQVTENYLRLNVAYSLLDVTSRGEYTLPNPPQSTAYLLDGKGIKHTISNTRGGIDTLFKGKVGDTYQLFVEADGNSYVSDKETMRACPELDSVIVLYSRESFRARIDEFYDGFDVYTQAQDVKGVENYYQWEWSHYSKATHCGKIFSQTEDRDLLIPCVPATCWSILTGNRVLIESDKLKDGNLLVKQVVRVPFVLPPTKYYLRVEQRAITPSVFSHLNAIRDKAENLGTLFDVPAQTSFNPNVFNIHDRGEKILGSFNVFSSRYKIIYIDMLQKIPGAQVKSIAETEYFVTNFLTSPCTEQANRTAIKPEGWID